jgi:hypothetical protein
MATLILSVSFGTAHADSRSGICNFGDACLTRTDILSAYPSDHWSNCAKSRRIRLDPGEYRISAWGDYNSEGITRRLSGGEYSWRIFLDPKNGVYVASTVVEKVSGGENYRVDLEFSLGGDQHMTAIDWGSTLDRE